MSQIQNPGVLVNRYFVLPHCPFWWIQIPYHSKHWLLERQGSGSAYDGEPMPGGDVVCCLQFAELFFDVFMLAFFCISAAYRWKADVGKVQTVCQTVCIFFARPCKLALGNHALANSELRQQGCKFFLQDFFCIGFAFLFQLLAFALLKMKVKKLKFLEFPENV